MSDKQPAEPEAQVARMRDLAEILREIGITLAEASLFRAVHYGMTVPPSDLIRRAADEFYRYELPDHPVTADDCRTALTGCLAKGWLQVIDESALRAIRDELRQRRLLGPIYGFPALGGVDFTVAGADLWQRFDARRRIGRARRPFAYTDVVHSKFSRYYLSRAAALAGIEDAREWDGEITVRGPFPIGPWRARWWQRLPEGYRIDVEEKRQWQGHCAAGRGCFMPDPRRSDDPQRRARADVSRLRSILDCHNVTAAEWLFLAIVDRNLVRSPSGLPEAAAHWSERDFGMAVSAAQCREALDACLRYGWLRIIDSQALAEIEALVREDTTAVPVLTEAVRWGEIDFTPCGAALYRMIAAEWLGSDWEEDLSVWKESYREEHRYCESEEGFQGNLTDCEDEGEIVRARRVVPIGPWCVYWWKRFASGFRLELEIGDPG